VKIFTIIADIFWFVIRFFKRKDANEIPDAVNQARADAVKGDDAATNDDLDRARDRMRDGSAGGRN
jgi:hypothetical protein